MDLGYHNFRQTHIGALTLSTRTSKYFRSEARNGPTTIGNHFSYQRCRHWVGKASQPTVCFGVSFIFKLCIHFSSSSIPRLALVSNSLALITASSHRPNRASSAFRCADFLREIGRSKASRSTIRIWSWHAIECDLLLRPDLRSCWWHLHHGQNMV